MRRLLGSILFAVLLAAPASAQDLGIAVGSTAPAAALQTLDGKDVNLSQWIGRTPVVMMFWATWCPTCRELEPTMRAARAKYGSQATFMAVAVSVNQSPERVRRHLARTPMPFEVLYDHEGEASGAYDVPATSYVVVIDRAGKVVYTGVGSRQDIEGAIRRAL